MSERNIEQWRRWFEAYNARDTETLIEYCDPGIEFCEGYAHKDDALKELGVSGDELEPIDP